MFGDDPDPTVTTAWVGFEGVSDTREKGCEYCVERVKRSGIKRMPVSRKVNRDEEEAATINGCMFFEETCNAMLMMT